MSQQLALKATATAIADQGTFTAIAAAYSLDHHSEMIAPGAFTDTAERWRQSGKLLPVAWNHSVEPEDLIGSIDPHSLVETDEGLQVTAQLDIETSARAREAWRSVKSRSIGLSFGFLVVKSHDEPDGVRVLDELDLYEVSLTATPANSDTRIIAAKSQDWREVRQYEDGDGNPINYHELRELVKQKSWEREHPVQVASFDA